MSNTKNNVAEAATANTDDKALSAASKTEPPAADQAGEVKKSGGVDLNGDGRVTLTERVTLLESILADVVEALEAVASNSDATLAQKKASALKAKLSLLKV